MPRPKINKNPHLLGVRIEEDIHKKLKKLAAPESVSTLVRTLLREYVSNNVK